MAGRRGRTAHETELWLQPQCPYARLAAAGKRHRIRAAMNSLLLQQPTRAFLGPGCAQRCVEESARAGLKGIYVGSGPTAARNSSGLIAEWRLRGAVVEVSNTLSREPEIALVGAVRAAARPFAPAAVMRLGGASPLDVAKLVAEL